MIREFLPDEDAEVRRLQDDCSVGKWLIPVGYRAGLTAGVKRALVAAESADGQFVAIAAIRKILEV